MTIIIFLIVLAVLIFSHELGHFLVAKFFKIRVDEFGLGFPPRLFGVRKGETLYSLNLIPLGGFVSIFGENPNEESLAGTDSSRAMVNKPKLVQAGVLVAGVLANLLLAWLLISTALSLGVPASKDSAPWGLEVESPSLMVTNVLPNSPAEVAGLKPGDKITAISTLNKELSYPGVVETQDFIAESKGEEMVINYTKGYEKVLYTAKVKAETGLVGDKWAIGVGLDLVGNAKAPWPKNLIVGAALTFNLVKTSLLGLGQIIASVIGSGESLMGAVVGPVGLAGLVGDAKTLGLAYLMFFTAFISVNLAIFNLIPFPALDGGRLLFLLIEAIKGSRLSPKVANTANLIGFSLLILFMIFVTYNDIVRLL